MSANSGSRARLPLCCSVIAYREMTVKKSAPSINESAECKTHPVRTSGCSLLFAFGIENGTNGYRGHHE